MTKKIQHQEQNQNARLRFGKTVRKRRRELDFTQEYLAEQADVARTYISNLERGKINPSLETIVKLAKALQISVSELFLNSGL